jgi:hypothetical protein
MVPDTRDATWAFAIPMESKETMAKKNSFVIFTSTPSGVYGTALYKSI